MAVRRDPYETLGVSPDSEEVVIRAAYRALSGKYRDPATPPDAWDAQRGADIDAAYAILREPATRRAYDRQQEESRSRERAPPPPAAPLSVSAQHRHPPPRAADASDTQRTRRAGPWLLAAGAAAAGLTWWAMSRARDDHPRPEAAAHGLTVRKRLLTTAASLVRPLPCYVDGRSVGLVLLRDCASRNGVATGPLDVGLESSAPPPPQPGRQSQPRPATQPTQLAAAPPVALRSPVSTSFGRAPSPATEGSTATHQVAAGSASPASGGAPQVVQAFYAALAVGDGARAAALVIPEKRASGPLSAGRMSRFYASFRQPLRLTQIYPLDGSTVFVRYRFVTREGGHCRGAANVVTTSREGRTLIRGIRAYNGC